MIIVTAKAKAFSGEGVKVNRFLIDNEIVKVWDSVAGYFTTCHILSQKAKKRIISLSKKKKNLP